MPLDPELRLLLALTRRLPPVPRAAGLGNHVVRRWYLRKPRMPVDADVLGHAMTLDPADLVDGLLLFTPQLFDRPEVAALREGLRPGDTFVDGGAYVGFYALTAAAIVGPRGRVVAVEPHPRTVERLRDHVRRASHEVGARIDVVEAALSDVDGDAVLTTADVHNTGASTLLGPPSDGTPKDAPADGPVDRARVRTVRLSTVSPRIDGLKLDLEGMEHRVLRRYLDGVPRERWPRILVVEHHPSRVAEAGGDALALLRDAGYRLVRGSRHNWIARR